MEYTNKTTLRIQGVGIEVDLSKPKPVLNLNHVASALGVTIFTIVSQLRISVTPIKGLFPSGQVGLYIADVIDMLGGNSSLSPIARRTLRTFLIEQETALNIMTAKNRVPVIRHMPDSTSENAPIRLFLAFNNIELTDAQCQKLGKYATDIYRSTRLGSPSKVEISVHTDHGFIKRHENIYPYSVMTKAFEKLVSTL